MVLALMGGVLGVLMMIPLRRYLIVKEHGKLTYPEGTACAEVLIVGEKGGTQASLVFRGLFVGALYKFLNLILALWNEFPDRVLAFYHRTARVRLDTDPALMGVGYIIGYRSSALMVGGGVLASPGAHPHDRALRRRSYHHPLPGKRAHLRDGTRRHLVELHPLHRGGGGGGGRDHQPHPRDAHDHRLLRRVLPRPAGEPGRGPRSLPDPARHPHHVRARGLRRRSPS